MTNDPRMDFNRSILSAFSPAARSCQFQKIYALQPRTKSKISADFAAGGGKPLFFPPDFFSRKNVTKILFKLEVTGLILAKSRKLGVPRAHPTCAEISVSNNILLSQTIF